jgi:hypothetical protein
MVEVRLCAYIFHSESLKNDTCDWGDVRYLSSQGTELLEGRKSWLYGANRNTSVPTDRLG